MRNYECINTTPQKRYIMITRKLLKYYVIIIDKKNFSSVPYSLSYYDEIKYYYESERIRKIIE